MIQNQKKVKCVERLLRLKLPGYIVSCMLAAGFDTLDTLARMDVGNQPGNSIQIIEEYMSSNFPGDARYMHAPLLVLGSTCKFPPLQNTVLESSDLCKNCAQATYVKTSSMMLFGLLRRKRKKTVNQKPQQLHKLQLEKFLL